MSESSRLRSECEARGYLRRVPNRQPLQLTVNGRTVEREVVPWTTLLDFLREELQLTGSKKGCDHGQCGACTVLVDGRRVNACLTLALQKDGAEVTTIEGLAEGERLHPLQQQFIEQDAFQCGYCTPGQICSALGMLREGHADVEARGSARERRGDDAIREQMSGNLCRCGAYPNILAAIRNVMKQGGTP